MDRRNLNLAASDFHGWSHPVSLLVISHNLCACAGVQDGEQRRGKLDSDKMSSMLALPPVGIYECKCAEDIQALVFAALLLRAVIV
jgi:hypothetical protein